MSTRKAVPVSEKAILSVRDVAAALGVQPNRVYTLISEGVLPSVRVGSKSGGVRIPRQAFEEHLHGLNEAARASVFSPAPASPSTRSLRDIFPQVLASEEALTGPNSIAALIKHLTPTPEQQARSAEAVENFLIGLRNAAPRR